LPRSYPTPADPPQPHPIGCFVSASGTLKPSPSASLLLTRLYQASESAVSLTAYVIPCVRFNRFVRLLTSPPHGCNTRYEWLVRPYSTGAFTQPETPSFAWRTSVLICVCSSGLLPPSGRVGEGLAFRLNEKKYARPRWPRVVSMRSFLPWELELSRRYYLVRRRVGHVHASKKGARPSRPRVNESFDDSPQALP